MTVYPNIQPYKGLGRYSTLPFQNHNKLKQEQWEIRRCNSLVGGERRNNCLGQFANNFVLIIIVNNR